METENRRLGMETWDGDRNKQNAIAPFYLADTISRIFTLSTPYSPRICIFPGCNLKPLCGDPDPIGRVDAQAQLH